MFYNTRGGDNAITIRLAGARYTAIVVDPADPAATVAAVNATARAPDNDYAEPTRLDNDGQ